MAKYNRPNGKLFGSSASNIGVFGSGQQNETPTTSTDPNAINTLGTHWEDGWNGAVVSQAPYTAPYVEDMNAVNYVNSYNSAYLLQRGIAEYSATEEYQKDSLCTYNSEIWMCKLDNTVGQTPAEGTYWHLQGEVPVMNDNEILVGAVGGTPTVVDTNGQGDVVASATGLNIKSGVIVNADVKSDAGIDESKLALDYSTSALEGTISGHIGDTANPHSVTKAQVLSGDLIVNADVDGSAGIKESKLDLDYATDTLNTNIGNVAGDLSTHTGNKNNPHETKIANLNDVTITNLQDGDVILYSLADDKYVNQQPPGGALTTLTDTVITSPIANKSLVQYNLNDAKWENSTEVWDTITVNDIAYVGVTPQGRTLDGNNNVTMLTTDNRHQILTATDGFNITLPSTGIKAGEKFVFDFPKSVDYFSTPFVIKVGANALCYSYNGYFTYVVLALADNPSSLSDWTLCSTIKNGMLIKSSNSYKNTNVSLPSNSREYISTGNLFTLGAGKWRIDYNFGVSNGDTDGFTISPTNTCWFYVLSSADSNSFLPTLDGDYLGHTIAKNYQYNRNTATLTINGVTAYSSYFSSNNISKISNINHISTNISAGTSLVNTGASTIVYFGASLSSELIAPITTLIS